MERDTPSPSATLGVVVVTFDAREIILDCLESLLGSRGVRLRIVVVDNGSGDGTPGTIRDWAANGREAPPAGGPVPIAPAVAPFLADTPEEMAAASGHALQLVETGRNTGFAGGVNAGLAELARIEGIDRFWILNPDSVVPPDTARAFATHPAPMEGFSLMGGRVLYYDRPEMIQIDGGTIDRRTGITGNVNLFAPHAETPPADPAGMDFITGASMVASRRFYEEVGPLREDYFLYYEEVDWALRRGDLPLAYCPEAVVYHRAGTAIGSATHSRPPSPFSLYFKHRARLMFLRRFFAGSLATGQAYSLAKAGQYLAKGYPAEARALLAGAFGRPPSATVTGRLDPSAREILARHRKGASA